MIDVLKQNKFYKVPTKSIIWTIDKNILNLTVKIDWNIYEKSENILPPIDLGVIKEWKIQVNEKTNIAIFTASWDIRRVKDKLKNINIITNNIFKYSVDE